MKKLVSVAVFADASFLPGLSKVFELIVQTKFFHLFFATQDCVQLSEFWSLSETV